MSNSIKRRSFIKYSGASLGATIAGAAGVTAPANNPQLHTRLCDLLKIKYPILQSGMGGVAVPQLAAKVSDSGGLGIIAGTWLEPEVLRKRIIELRSLTTKPFGVNLMLHDEMVNPKTLASVPGNLMFRVQQHLNLYRQKLNIPQQLMITDPLPNYVKGLFEVIVQERVPVWSIGLGKPSREQVQICRGAGIKIIGMVCTVRDAREMEQAGVDVIVAQGSEAGGHRSTWFKKESKDHAAIGLMTLLPQVINAVKVPVVAAGGISDGKDVRNALMMGASGVMMGTRFMATKESGASDMHKQALVNMGSDDTTLTDKCSGAYARVIRNQLTTHYEKTNGPVLPPWIHVIAMRDIYRAAISQNKPDYYSLWSGQGIGKINDIPSAAEIMQRIVKEASA